MPLILQFNSWVGKIPWRIKWQHTPVFLPGESHRQRSLEATVPEVARVGHNLVTNPHAPYGMLGKYYKNIKKESTK